MISEIHILFLRLITFRGSNAKGGLYTVFLDIFKTAITLPRRIQAICWVQFWSWIGVLTCGTPSVPYQSLTSNRLVPLHVLQHDLGWGDLFPL